MSPETITNEIPILEASRRIADELVAIESEERAISVARKKERLSGARERMGYTPAEDIDLSGLVDARIEDKDIVIAPEDLTELLPLSKKSTETTRQSRETAADIIQHKNGKLLVIVGPCSIHNAEEALEYAAQVKVWREEYGDELEILMRFYPEKPRSEKDWKGYIYDPLLDGSDDMNLGVVATRMLGCRMTDMGVPLAMERLNANTPQFLNGLVTYDAIGARNAADQKAREYLSGTSSVGGIKNPQDGNLTVAAQGVASANQSHGFIGMDESGALAHVKTLGNETAHVILRGSDTGTNYGPEDIQAAKELLNEKGLLESIIVDASHGNSNKKAENQIKVIASVSEQIALGEVAIRGVMIESNLKAGNQNLKDASGNYRPKEDLEPGVSVTDECVDLTETAQMLKLLAQAASSRRKILQHIG